MPSRKQLDRERLEVYLVYIFLGNRPLFFLGGTILLIFSVLVIFSSRATGAVALVMAIALIVIASSYQATLYLAKFGAWIGTLWKKE